ncbi:FepA family TonB-dependent siderophore receptor [Gilvimarinus xylanilyticus]|uniref:FepA family TonB-dependent siderophore receptor n=1 Tax=Gilvimarinus xylanilyticus TaxID=2944139 RepID=A0A9X2HZZ9_9GAMM|nr:FepA family TonB-dependent siderophore receptor [Gilvimarinus xylanilyticus]MCP8900889.1 FepA family TonB-dependent siderophore receptor [Gilvimarinus xylanilyticus]
MNKLSSKLALMGALFPMCSTVALAQQSQDDEVQVLKTTVVQAASEELKQAQGVSIVTEEDMKHRPVANDIAEIVRTMPGVNLSGNSSSGQYGNNRQIDIRGMGPENTLILIDGKPVLSRNSVKMGRSGERNTRGDSNWVPPEAIERIEVIRGPAAARYGSGAAGGVVNIITKKPDEATATITAETQLSEDSMEGDQYRANIVAASPLTERFSQRTYISYNKQDADDVDINRDETVEGSRVAAGREGVENQDFRTMLRFDQSETQTWELEGAYSRQGNIYAGDNAFQGVDHEMSNLLVGEETNVMRRKTLSLTHKGNFSFGDSFSYIQWENTNNSRLGEGAAGGGDGAINSEEFVTTELQNISAKTEWNTPVQLGGLNQTITYGAEYRSEELEDDVHNQNGLGNVEEGDIPGTIVDPDLRPSTTDADLFGVYIEDNIALTDTIMLTPGVRFDSHSESGTNWSPSVNASWQATSNLSLQAGVSRAFKTPNLYQLNPNYAYRTRGNGCPLAYPSLGGGCTILGNPDLEAETSINSEIGVNYTGDSGFATGLTYFHNDYENKITTSGTDPIGVYDSTQVFRWENAPEAIVEGLEGNLSVPFAQALTFTLNATVMLESKDTSTGEPLSIIPDYTLNSMLVWSVTDRWDMVLSGQHYGPTDSPKLEASGDVVENQMDRDAYNVINFSTNYAFGGGFEVVLSVKNLVNDQLKREGTSTNAGANTYNEPGRSYLVSLSKTF